MSVEPSFETEWHATHRLPEPLSSQGGLDRRGVVERRRGPDGGAGAGVEDRAPGAGGEVNLEDLPFADGPVVDVPRRFASATSHVWLALTYALTRR